MTGWGSNGQWVRARNAVSAKAFVAERELEEQRRREREDRLIELLGRAWTRLRGRYRRRNR